MTGQTLDASSIGSELRKQVEQMSLRQLREGAESGAILNRAWGIGDPSQNGTLAFVCGCAAAACTGEGEGTRWIGGALAAMEYMGRAVRETGRLDLRDCNFDSGPDTAFAVGLMCATLDLLDGAGRAELAELRDAIDGLAARAARGLLDGGFHTPNHRWVVASALAMARRRYGELDPAAGGVIEAYVAEGIDIDADGAFLERSPAAYDAVCDRSLLLLSEYYGLKAGEEAAVRNLDLNLHLLHGDGSIETALSRRQDQGKVVVPAHLAHAYLYAGMKLGEKRYVAAARYLFSIEAPGVSDLVWMLWLGRRFGPVPVVEDAGLLPVDFARTFGALGLHRIRRALLSASIFAESTHLMSLRYGQAQLSSVRIAQPYFGLGRFMAEKMEVSGGRVVLTSEGRRHPRRPGYEMPLGRAVAMEKWEEAMAGRAVRAMAAARSTLEISEAEGGLDLRYRTDVGGTAGVCAQLVFDFAVGGFVETEDVAMSAGPGQQVFLKRGVARVRYGDDVISIGPGHHGHTMLAMRDAEGAGPGVRVLLTFQTPVDHSVMIRCWRGV